MHPQDGAAKHAAVNRAKIIWLVAIGWLLLSSVAGFIAIGGARTLSLE
jgi:hypothetical protein